MPQKFTNQARATLTNSIGPADAGIVVTPSLADRFPVANTPNWLNPLDWFKIVVIAEDGSYEVMRVGNRAPGSGVLNNILRGQDGTTAKNFTAGNAIVLHGPMAADIEAALAGVFSYTAVRDANDPKFEISKTGAGAASAMFHMVNGKVVLAQSNGAGGVLADRFTFDQTNGLFTTQDFSMLSDERLKSAWRGVGRNFLQRLADVTRGTYRMKGQKRRMVGVSAQSLREVMPEVVHEAADGTLSVSYGQAALVAAIELAAEVGYLRAALADLHAEVKASKGRK